MKNLKSIFVSGVLAASLVGCATTPPVEEMSQLNGEQLDSAVSGNTWTYKADWGRWAEYIGEDRSGIGRAWGNWGEEKATAEYAISDEGEICTTYSDSDAEWAGPDHEYCSLVYVDASGNYYSKNTKNTYKPERVGKLRKFEVKPGNHYELSM